jgi:hypothetical protein
MKCAFRLIIIFAATHTAWNKSGMEGRAPKCFENRIREFKNIACDQGANVKEYLFQGKTVYVMNYSTPEQRSIKDATAHANFAIERRGTCPGIPTSRKSRLSGCGSVTGCFAPLTLSSFDPGNCGADMPSAFVDHNYNNLGEPGGFAGNAIINNEDFSDAVFIKTLFEN